MMYPKILRFGLLLSATILLTSQSSSQDASKQIDITADLFKCLTEMSKSGSGSFFVDNLLGNKAATETVAASATGGQYPPGSVISLIPTEVMVKHNPGWNAGTNDWEFIELNVSAEGSEIVHRGTTDVINRFGGNCFDCHKLARPEWDFVCGTDHGCAPLPIDRATILAIQNGDPRCVKEN
jgi:hypothetical protein